MRAERRLLVVTETLGIGGTESHLIRKLGPLAAQGWKATVYCITAPGNRGGRLEAAECFHLLARQPPLASAP